MCDHRTKEVMFGTVGDEPPCGSVAVLYFVVFSIFIAYKLKEVKRKSCAAGSYTHGGHFY